MTGTAKEKMLDAIARHEQAVAMLAMSDPYSIDEMRTTAQPADFRDQGLGELYRVLLHMRDAGIPVTLTTVAEECARTGVIDRHITLHELYEMHRKSVGMIPTDAGYHARHVAAYAAHIRLMQAADRLLVNRYTVDPIATTNTAKARFDAATDGILDAADHTPIRFGQAVRETVEKHRSAAEEGKQLGMATGFPSLDQITGGFHRGQLVLVGGRTFAGKTALGLAFASYFAQKMRPVYMISLEMDRTELAERILADDCGFELRAFTQTGLSRDELATIEGSQDDYDAWPFSLSDSPNETTRSIRAKAKLQKAATGLDLLIVDNLQLIRPEDSSIARRLQLTTISAELKRLAKELDCCVLLLTQLNADAEGREPDDTHYSESKQILADADVAMLAHRADKTDSDFILKITKNRRGTQGRVTLHFDGAYQRFTDPMLLAPQEWQP